MLRPDKLRSYAARRSKLPTILESVDIIVPPARVEDDDGMRSLHASGTKAVSASSSSFPELGRFIPAGRAASDIEEGPIGPFPMSGLASDQVIELSVRDNSRLRIAVTAPSTSCRDGFGALAWV